MGLSGQNANQRNVDLSDLDVVRSLSEAHPRTARQRQVRLDVSPGCWSVGPITGAPSVQGLPEDDAWREEIARTFVGRAYADLSEPRSRTAVESIEMMLRVFAKDLLDDAHQYNAAKHGLAVNPMPSIGLTIGNAGQGGPLHHPGPAFQILEYAGEPRTWKMTTRWVDPEQTMAYQRIAVLLLRSVWSLGRVMHTDTTEATIFEMPAAIYDLVTKEGGFRFDRFSIGLGALLSTERQPPETNAPCEDLGTPTPPP